MGEPRPVEIQCSGFETTDGRHGIELLVIGLKKEAIAMVSEEIREVIMENKERIFGVGTQRQQ